MEEILIVDGYNIIGAWSELSRLKESSLEEARDRLLDLLAEYQAFSGKTVHVVFDAYRIPGKGVRLEHNKLKIYYTKEKETADEWIEKLVSDLKGRRKRIVVATSDSVEQSVAFGQGALRLSARELFIDIRESQVEVDKKLHETHSFRKRSIDEKLNEETKLKFERWRRGK